MMMARDTTRTAKVWHVAVIRHAQQKFGMWLTSGGRRPGDQQAVWDM